MNQDRTSGVADVQGAQFGKYRIVRKLGDGTYGAVYEAFQPGAMGFSKRVAIKRLRSHLVAGDRRFLQSMVNEARIGALIHHANIVNILEFDQVEGHYYLAMEYVDGATLEEVIRLCQRSRVLLPRFAVVDLMTQVCRGLHHAHEMRDHDGRRLNLIHRDIKPSNLIVDRDGTARILDFGIAKAATNLFNNTAPGLTKGTPRYMSPEQLRGEYPLKPRSDVFSAGVVLYELITARPLFYGESLAALLHQVVSADISTRLDQAEVAFPGCRPILERALDRDSARRYQDARSLGRDLRGLGRRFKAEAETADVVRVMLPVLERPQHRRIEDASQLEGDDELPEADGFVDDEHLVGAPPIAPPPSDSSGWAEFTAAITAHGPVSYPRDELADAFTLATADLETIPPAGIPAADPAGAPPAVAKLSPPPPTPVGTPTVKAPPARRSRRSSWWYLLLAPAVIVAGFGLGVIVVAAWSASQSRGGAGVPVEEPTAGGDASADGGESATGVDAVPDRAETTPAERPTPAAEVNPTPETPTPEPRTPEPTTPEPSTPAVEREDPTPRRPPAEEKDEAPGTISLYVTQWSQIYVDRALVASEANFLRKHEVSGGRHTVKVVCGSETCPCSGLTKSYRVTVDGDDVKLPHLDFQELAGDCPGH